MPSRQHSVLLFERRRDDQAGLIGKVHLTVGGGERRSANSERGSVGIYFVAGAASAGYTFTSTRRF